MRPGGVLAALVAVLLVALGATPAAAADPSAPSGWRTVTYHGEQFAVPVSWAEADLTTAPTTCVRFDRHAVYLGAPGPDQACPASIIGVTEAVSVQPWSGATLDPALRATTVAGQPALASTDGAVAHRSVVAFPAAGVLVTVTWGSDPSTARGVLDSFRALAVASGLAPASSAGQAPASSAGHVPASSAGPAVRAATEQGASRALAVPGSAPPVRSLAAAPTSVSVGPVSYTGPGFDTCTPPSPSALAAWHASTAYRAVGVYIGGANAACSPSTDGLSAGWVTGEVTAGWRLMPIYVGLQASCADQVGLAPISTSVATAAAEGAAAADDAATQAAALGMHAGSPVYDDMEAWDTTNASCSATVVAFVRSWSSTVAGLGYTPGVYGSADAGVAQDLAPLWGTPGAPSDLWFADWDGQSGTTSSYLTGSYYPGSTRIKQYEGDVTETHAGVTLSIDRDSVAATVVGNQSPQVSALSPPSSPVGQSVTVTGAAFVAGHTSVAFGGVPASGVVVRSSTSLTAIVPARTPASVAVTVTTRAGTSVPGAGSTFTYVPVVAVTADPSTSGYWLTTARGNVYGYRAPWKGSAATVPLPAPVVGAEVDGRTGGYRLVTSAGNVYGFGAPFEGSMRGRYLPAPVVGMAADPATGGYWLVTSAGNVYGFGAPFEGSMRGRYLPAPVVGMAADPATGGYWLVTSAGNVYGFGAPFEGSMRGRYLPAPVVGMAADPATGGYWLVTSAGNVYGFGAPFEGSMRGRYLPAPVVGMAAAGSGYVLATSAGNVDNFATRWYGSLAG